MMRCVRINIILPLRDIANLGWSIWYGSYCRWVIPTVYHIPKMEDTGAEVLQFSKTGCFDMPGPYWAKSLGSHCFAGKGGPSQFLTRVYGIVLEAYVFFCLFHYWKLTCP